MTAKSKSGAGIRHLGVLLLLSLSISGSLLGQACAEEPVEAFLTALRGRGYFDEALAYLDRVSQQDVSDDLQATIGYERGVTLVAAALGQRQQAGKQAYLDQAQKAFEDFVAANPNHSLSFAANRKLGDILVERARIQISRADRPSVDKPQQQAMHQEARGYFKQANAIYETNRDKLRERLQALPKSLDPRKDADLYKERDQLRSDYVQTQFVSAMISYETARSHQPGSRKHKEGLKQAEQAFGNVAEKYRKRVAGLTAILFQGRCRQESQDLKGALTYFNDLLELPDNETALRRLKTSALVGASTCWLDESIDQPESAIEYGASWLKKERPDERSDTEWHQLKVLVGRALLQKSDEERGSSKSRMRADARRFALDVARQKSPHQAEAQELLAQLGAPTKTESPESDINSFAEAFDAAKAAINNRQVAAGTISLLQGRLPRIQDTANRQEVEKRLAEAKQQVQDSEEKAFTLLIRANELIDEEVTAEELNTLRYFLCTLHYYRGDYYSAAVIGDYLARRFPSSVEGRSAASVALASLVKLFGDGSDPSTAELSGRIARTADFIATRWSGQPEAADALSTLVTLNVQSGNLQEAEEYLKRIPENSAKRGMAELATGQALWNESLKNGDADDAIVPKAIELLTAGLEHTADDAVSPSRIAAAISLTQHHLEQGDTKAALRLLEAPGYGPKTLADQNHPAIMSNRSLAERAYMLAVLAHIGSLNGPAPEDDAIEKALSTLASLKQQLGDDAAGKQRLSLIYVTLAKNLQNQINEADPAQRESLSSAFKQFLKNAAASTEELSVKNWIAESYMNLGQGMLDAAGNPTPESQDFFTEAAAIYDSIIDQADQGAMTLSPRDRLKTQNRRAMAYRDNGDFSKAIDILAAVLQQQETQVYVQFEAAKTLQQWGDRGNADAYMKAILGDRVKSDSNENLIWGYGRIAKIVANSPKLKSLFHDSRYRLAESRYQYALRQSQARREELLGKAKNDIVFTARLYPEMGGEEQKAKYNQLLKKIQQALGQQPSGFGD